MDTIFLYSGFSELGPLFNPSWYQLVGYEFGASSQQQEAAFWRFLIGVTVIVAFLSMALLIWVQYKKAADMVLKETAACRISAGDETELFRIVQNQCVASGLPQPALFLMETDAANAYSTGFHPRCSALVVTRGLLRLLDEPELEAVVAQQLSQIGNYDTRLKTTVATAVTVLALPLRFVLRVFNGPEPGLFEWREEARSLARSLLFIVLAVALVLGVGAIDWMISHAGLAKRLSEQADVFWRHYLPFLLLFVLPLVGNLLSRALSRRRVFLADADACLLTLNPDALASALAKMDTGRTAWIPVKLGLASLFVVAPSERQLFDSHPAVEQRIAALKQLSPTISPASLTAARRAAEDFRHLREFRETVASDTKTRRRGMTG
jgi:heat shock protein HtpX